MIQINEAKGSPKKKKLRTKRNGKFNEISSDDEKKNRSRAFI
jgi:hypothetical protein